MDQIIPTEPVTSAATPASPSKSPPAPWAKLAAGVFAVALALAAFSLFSRRGGLPAPPEHAAPLTAVPLAAPVTLFTEEFTMEQGAERDWSFTLPKPHTVELAVDSKPEPVVVYIVDAEHWAEFSQALATGKMTERIINTLQDSTTRHMDRTQVLGAGEWHVSIFRPKPSEQYQVSGKTQLTVSATAR